MNFNTLMDDMKSALILSKENKGLFIPALLANILFVVVMIAFVVVILISVAGTMFATVNDNFNWSLFIGYFIAAGVFITITSLLFLALDIGISGLVIGVVDGEKVSAGLFFRTIRDTILRIFFTKIGFFFIAAFAFVILFIPVIIYLVTVGIFTAGWGMVFLSCSIQVFFGIWTLILIEDRRQGFESIGVNISFGKKNFWPLLLVFYVNLSLAGYLPSLLGFIGASFAAIFISYMMVTYTKIVLLLSYRRYKAL